MLGMAFDGDELYAALGSFDPATCGIEDCHPKRGELSIVLDPGMAFGTGTHPTTQLCLAALEGAISPGMRVLEVGSSSGAAPCFFEWIGRVGIR